MACDLRSGRITGYADVTQWSSPTCRLSTRDAGNRFMIDNMRIDDEAKRRPYQFSVKDHILLVIMGFSGLLGFALSFTVLQADGRPYLFCGCLVVYLTCTFFATERRALVLATLGVIALRLIWSIAVTGVQGLHFWAQR